MAPKWTIQARRCVVGRRCRGILVAHEHAGQGQRGIRYITAQNVSTLSGHANAAMDDPMYSKVCVVLVSWDIPTARWCTTHNCEFVHVARACPDTPIVLDHLGCVLGTGPYKGRREEILEFWKAQIAEISDLRQCVLKLGGIGMPMMGFRWDKRDQPANSAELAEAWSDQFNTQLVIGANRCMFESNFL